MARLPRITQNRIFGLNTVAGGISQFGSLKAGTPVTTTDVTVIQALTNFLQGWQQAVIGGNSPAIEDMNALFYVLFRQMAYLFESGVPEWDSSSTYWVGDVVNSSGALYSSLADNNTNNAVSNPTFWVKIGGTGALYPIVIGTAAQVTAGQATHSTFSSAHTAATAGDTIIFTDGLNLTENITISKKLSINLNNAVITGSATFATGSDYSRLWNGKLTDNVTVNSGVVGIVTDIILASGKSFIDNSTLQVNALFAMQET